MEYFQVWIEAISVDYPCTYEFVAIEDRMNDIPRSQGVIVKKTLK